MNNTPANPTNTSGQPTRQIGESVVKNGPPDKALTNDPKSAVKSDGAHTNQSKSLVRS